MQCPRCPSVVDALGFGEHVGRVHVGRDSARWQCQECPYESTALNDAIAHCLIHQHDPTNLRMSTPRELLVAAKEAIEHYVSPRITRPNGPLCSNQDPEMRIQRSLTDYRPGLGTNPSYTPEYTSLAQKVESECIHRLNHESEEHPIHETLPIATNDPPIIPKRRRIRQVSAVWATQESLPLPTEEPESKPTPEKLADDHPDEAIESNESREQCEKCGSVVKVSDTAFGVRHVISCLKLKPYACSECGIENIRRAKIAMHIGKSHASCLAEPKLRAKEQDEALIRRGLSECFPNLNYTTWAGLN